MAGTPRCPAGHALPGGRGRICSVCRRDHLISQVTAVEMSLSGAEVAAAVGAPPAIGRLVTELIARGSTTVNPPRCVACGRTGGPLTVTDHGGMCKPCAARRDPAACTHCGVVKPVAGRTGDGAPICEACRRHQRGQRRCGNAPRPPRSPCGPTTTSRTPAPTVIDLPLRSAACAGGCARAPWSPPSGRSAGAAPADDGSMLPLRPRPPTGRPLGRRPLVRSVL